MNNFIDLYNYVMSSKDDNIYNFLLERWYGKDKQESLFRLFAYLKLIKEFDIYDICDGNFNNGTLVKNTNKSILFEKSLNDKGDKSELSLIKDDDILICSSKNKDSYSVNDLDIDNIQNIFSQNYKNKYTLSICIIVKDKKELYNSIKNAEKTSKRLVDVLQDKTTFIYDWDDINRWYHDCKTVYKYKTIIDICKTDKQPLINMFHQELAIYNTIELSKIHNNILWGHIPRSGKSYIMGGFIHNISTTKQCNFLIITLTPKESKNQYIDIFTKYSQFESFNIVILQDYKKKPKLTDKNIIICSKHFLQSKGVKEDKIKTIKWLKDLKINWLFIDECHHGGSTPIVEKILDIYGEGSKKIYITATYNKPQNCFNIPRDAWILWDLEDVKLCKTINKRGSIEKLKEKHGENLVKILEKYDKNHIIKEYNYYPTIEFITWDFTNTVKDAILDKYNDSNTGFSTDAIFLLKHKNKEPICEFQDEEGVIKLIHTIFGNNKQDKLFKIKENSIMNRIEKICKNGNINSRYFSKEEPLIILAFLPCGLTNTPLHKLQETLYNLIISKNLLPDFDIIYMNSNENNTEIPITIINNAMVRVKLNNKKGLLILSGRMCSLAISINKCDIVLMLNNTENIETYSQMMYRSMTEDRTSNKKIGFVVDMNLQRVCNIITDYSIKLSKNTSVKQSIKYVLEQNLIGLNSDNWMHTYFGLTSYDITTVVDKIYNNYISKPSNTIDNILKSLELKVKILSADQELFNKLFTISSVKKEDIVKIIEELTNDNAVKKGIDVVQLDDRETDTDKPKKIKEQNNINFITDIMKPLMPLLCLLTIQNTDIITFKEFCNWINEKKIEKDIIVNQLSIWWSKTITNSVDIIGLFIVMYDKYLLDNDEFNNTFTRLKEMFNIARGNKNELSKIIDKYLIPQEIEKKQHAEVSTPYELRQVMINKIPSDFWNTPKKVFEPCSGKGGFLLDIIDKFMNGLKDVIEDDDERYRIIVEECLYWSEFNPTNVYICKLLLDPFNKYNLKYNEGDTLKLDIKEKWNIGGFDAVIGNPPYNDDSGNKGRGHNIWTNFVEKTLKEWLNKDAFMLYVHPSVWRQENHYLQKLIKEKQIIYLEIHNIEDGLKVFKCSTRYDWYLLQNKEYNGKTIIKCEDGIIEEENLVEWTYIPNMMFKELKELCNSNEKLDVNYYRSDYGADKKWIKNIKTNGYIYPVIYSINKNNNPSLKYSNINTNGHFNKTKFIFSNGAGFICDDTGKYGLTQWAYCIYDIKDNLKNIEKCFRSEKFNRLKKAIQLDSSSYNIKVMKHFRKDFWKEFIYTF